LQPDQISDTSTTELEVSKAPQPAPGAEDQKPTAPASGADDQNSEVAETPEQQRGQEGIAASAEQRQESTSLADARAEAKLLREERDRLNAKLEAQPKPSQEALASRSAKTFRTTRPTCERSLNTTRSRKPLRP
jgi:hypothetical protein